MGAVPAGTTVALKLRVDRCAKARFSEVRLLVGEPGDDITALEWSSVPLAEEPDGYRAFVEALGEPHVMFYVFELLLVDGESLFYVPRADGRSTMGELVVPDSIPAEKEKAKDADAEAATVESVDAKAAEPAEDASEEKSDKKKSDDSDI